MDTVISPIRRLREQARYTRAALSAKLRIHYGELARLEYGHSPIRPSTCATLAQEFGMTPESLTQEYDNYRAQAFPDTTRFPVRRSDSTAEIDTEQWQQLRTVAAKRGLSVRKYLQQLLDADAETADKGDV